MIDADPNAVRTLTCSSGRKIVGNQLQLSGADKQQTSAVCFESHCPGGSIAFPPTEDLSIALERDSTHKVTPSFTIQSMHQSRGHRCLYQKAPEPTAVHTSWQAIQVDILLTARLGQGFQPDLQPGLPRKRLSEQIHQLTSLLTPAGIDIFRVADSRAVVGNVV